MSKDPAIIFYTADFLVGSATLTNEDCGRYIRLLCYMHQKGRMSKKTIDHLVSGSSVELLSMFKLDNEELYFSERLELEAEKRKSYSKSRAFNAKKTKEEYIEELVYPFDSDNFKRFWEIWKDYKKQSFRFNYKTLVSEQSALKQLSNFSNGDEKKAIHLIENAISKQWQGIYQDDNYGKQNSKRKESYDPNALSKLNDFTS